MKIDNNHLIQDFNRELNQFLSAPEVAPPISVRETVLARVSAQLNPSSQSVFLKILGIHAIVSLFTLSICSQFGIQSIKIYDAMDSMMEVVGHTYCMAGCGVLYLGVSAFSLSFLLRSEEIKVIRRHSFLQFACLVGISLGAFLCLGAEVLLLPAALWIVGSLLGGITSLELGWMIRSKLRRQLGTSW